MRSAYKTLVGDLGGRVILEDQRVNGKIVLKLIVKECVSAHFEDKGGQWETAVEVDIQGIWKGPVQTCRRGYC